MRTVEITLSVRENLGFSEAQLESMFGHSGLGRYRKMLAESGPKVIEHKPLEVVGSVRPTSN
jgi:hypothetical protein